MSKDYIMDIKNAAGYQEIRLDDLKMIYLGHNRPKTNIVQIRDDYFVSFESAPKVQFKVIGRINDDQLAFIETQHFVNATKLERGLLTFVLYEFYQGSNWWRQILRAIYTVTPLVLVSTVAIFYATEQTVANSFNALLTAVSMFIAIFSLFTVSHEHLERKKISLFESGQLAYYFSVDKNITKLGVIAIFASLFAILIAPLGEAAFWRVDNKNWVILILLNITFFNTFLILRSIVEFYIHRPATFILGDMKKESLENYVK